MVKLHNKMRRYNRIDYLYNKFFSAAMKRATADPNADEEALYRLLMSATQEGAPLNEEYQEMAKGCHAIILTSTRASEVLQFTRMFKSFSATPWIIEKLLECATRADNLLEYVTFLANEGKSLPEGYQEKVHIRFVELCPSWAQFYAYVTFFDDGAYCTAVEDYFFNHLSVGEFNIKKLWDLFPEWRTPRLKALYESTTLYGLTLE